MTDTPSWLRRLVVRPLRARVRLDRNEFSGAFGDIGTDFPLIVAMILVADLDAASVLIMFGVMQVLSALRYGIPMPVQPLKAMAAIVITHQVAPEVLYGGGLAIGVIMLILVLTGAVSWLVRVIPRPVVRGLQVGLGLQLGMLALGYVADDGVPGYILGAAAFVIAVVLLGNRRLPGAPIIILLGVAYALLIDGAGEGIAEGVGLALPSLRAPTGADVIAGLFLLALPQLPLSLGNAIVATRQVAADLYPERAPSARQLGATYGVMNIVNPFFGGVPVCHGSGGLAGHHAFGGRTGGSVLIYGALFLTLGLFFSGAFDEVIGLFPMPVLGVILLIEGVALMGLARDSLTTRPATFVVLVVGLCAVALPYGYVVGLLIGTALYYGWAKGLLRLESGEHR